MFEKKSLKVLAITFLVYAVLVASHLGEFWPFSIYPMFSKAGNPWTRAIATDVSEVPDSLLWETTSHGNIQGDPVAIRKIGVDQIDFSNFVSKTTEWDRDRINALRFMLGEEVFQQKPVMIFKAKGRLTVNDSVIVEYIPYLLFKSDTTLFNPNLSENDYILK